MNWSIWHRITFYPFKKWQKIVTIFERITIFFIHNLLKQKAVGQCCIFWRNIYLSIFTFKWSVFSLNNMIYIKYYWAYSIIRSYRVILYLCGYNFWFRKFWNWYTWLMDFKATIIIPHKNNCKKSITNLQLYKASGLQSTNFIWLKSDHNLQVLTPFHLQSTT